MDGQENFVFYLSDMQISQFTLYRKIMENDIPSLLQGKKESPLSDLFLLIQISKHFEKQQHLKKLIYLGWDQHIQRWSNYVTNL